MIESHSASRVSWRGLAVFLAVFLPGFVCDLAAEERPNILLIVADDLGFSDLGCYGGEIETPNLDALADSGFQFTRMYSTGRCCPSRAALMTGQYPHAVGLGHMTIDLGRPGYRGVVAEDADTIADVLKRAGYSTWLSGKWHLGTGDPTQHGFNEYFGTLVSCKDFWSPERFYRISNGQPVDWHIESFHATDAVTDFALQFLADARETPDKPWFGYLAYHAPHFPLHAPSEDIAKYADTYQVGWDAIRQQRLARMKELGLMDQSVELPPRSRYADWGEADSGEVPAWDSLPAERQADLARRMAIYAAMVDRMDRQIGRVIADLKESGDFENTLILFLSDNGACAEWDPFGFDGVSGPDNKLHVGAELDQMGQPGTFHSAGSGWAMASNTPFRRFKHYCHEGGIRGPCILYWPPEISKPVDTRIVQWPVHLIDVLPTFAAVAGTLDVGKRQPAGHDLRVMFDSRALKFPFDDVFSSDLFGRFLFFEHEGNRAVLSRSEKLVAVRDQPWQLFQLEGKDGEAIDPAESNDLSKHPEAGERVKQLSPQWTEWADRNHVTPLPIDYGVQYLPNSGEAGRERMQDNDVGPPRKPVQVK